MIFGNAKYFSQISFLSFKRAAGCSSVSEIPQGRFRPPHSCAHAHTHTHTRTDCRCFCPVPADRWNRRSDASFPRASLMDAPVTGAVSARSDRSAVEKWNLGIHVISFSASPEQQRRTNARSRPLLLLSLSLTLPVSRYSAGNKLVFSQPSGPRFIS